MSDGVVEPAKFFALRTPLLPHDELVGWSSGLRAVTVVDDAAQLAAALEDDRRLLRERLRAIVKRPEVREALFLASPSLDESLAFWLEQPTSARGRKVERTLVRYFIRMSSRPTPFGLFAGCSVGEIGPHTRLVVDGIDRYQRHPRLDGSYLSSLTEALCRDPAVRRALTYRPNTTLYRMSGRIRLAEARLAGGVRSHLLAAVEVSEPLEIALARCAQGATFEQLTDALVSALAADEVSAEDAEAFVDELIDAQVVVADLDLPVTGAEPMCDLIEQLRASPLTERFAAQLEDTRSALAALAQSRIGEPPARYRSMAKALESLPTEVELSRLFQVDLVKPAPEAMLGPQPIAEIVRVAAVLHRLCRTPKQDSLSKFRAAFTTRYEGREVALTEVLDEDLGIGFERSASPSAEASPLLQDLDFGSPPADPEFSTDSQYRHLFSRLEDAIRSGAHEIVLDEPDLVRMEAGRSNDERLPLPDSLAAMVTIAGPSEQAVANGEFALLLHQLSGPSGASLLGRFCCADATLERHVRDYLKHEESRRPALFAEIVHLPEGRIGNVILRPVLRDCEITFLGRSGAPADKQILLDDLLVSVRNGRVVLRSRRLDCEVIPRLTTAHNFASRRNLGAYRFLCALQSQDVPSLRFSWGALEVAKFLPRVRNGRTVLSLARWVIDGEALEALKTEDSDQRFLAAQQLRKRYRLPRWIALADGDNVLPIDLDNILAVDTFSQLVKDRSRVAVTERFDTDGLCARGPEGRFVHELIVPLMSRAPVAAPERLTAPRNRLPRRFAPGSEWLYAKLYTGTAVADDVLRDVVAPVVAQAVESRAIDSWFFIRYSDPDWHVRVRFHGEPERLRQDVLPHLGAVAADAIGRGSVWRFQLDTYEREIERYGGDDAMLRSEQLFCADSDAVLGIVKTLHGDAGADVRWRLALRGMDQLLDDFGFTLEQKHLLIEECRRAFGREFESKARLDRQLGQKFRKERISLEALLDRGNDASSPLEAGLTLLDARSKRLAAIAASFDADGDQACVHASKHELAASWLHMHANRLLRGAARAQELVLYDFLERIYGGQLSRRRKSTSR